MNKKEIFKYLIAQNSSISVMQVVTAMMMALVLAMFMYFVYRKTYTGVVYSKGFNQTLVLIAVIVTMVMTIIGGNLALSLGMVGSLSIIRFRTAIKEPRDMAFLFWAISIGLSCGAEMYVVSLVGSAVVASLLFFFKLDAYNGNTYLLVVRGKGLGSSKVEHVLKKEGRCIRGYRLRMQNTSGSFSELTYEVSLRKQPVSDLVDKLLVIDGVENVNAVTYTGEVIS